jgi:hypothetical protein
MTRAKYPLEPLAKVRAHATSAQAAELAKAVRERTRAEAERRAADAARARAEASASEVRAREGEALSRGQLTVADLARGDAWEARVRAEGAALFEDVARAAEGEAAASDQETHARAELAQRRADADVVEKDRARFDQGQRRREEAREEEGAEEAWRPK